MRHFQDHLRRKASNRSTLLFFDEDRPLFFVEVVREAGPGVVVGHDRVDAAAGQRLDALDVAGRAVAGDAVDSGILRSTSAEC